MKYTTKIIMSALGALFALSVKADDVEINGINYVLNEGNKTASLKNVSNSYLSNVTIPTSVAYGGTDYAVNSIQAGAFKDCKKLASIDIASSIIEIGDSAFSNCI